MKIRSGARNAFAESTPFNKSIPGPDLFPSHGHQEVQGRLAFALQETAAYVKHHLRVAGRQDPVFSDGFLALVHDHTKGVACKINNLCRTALLLGATEQKSILDETDLKRVIRDLEGQIG